METWVLETNRSPPKDIYTMEMEIYKDAVSTTMDKSIPTDIRMQLPPGKLTLPPDQISAKSRDIILDRNESLHRGLETEKNMTKFEPGTTVEEYRTAHMVTRGKMRQE